METISEEDEIEGKGKGFAAFILLLKFICPERPFRLRGAFRPTRYLIYSTRNRR